MRAAALVVLVFVGVRLAVGFTREREERGEVQALEGHPGPAAPPSPVTSRRSPGDAGAGAFAASGEYGLSIQRRLKLDPRRFGETSLAFAKGRLGVLEESALAVRDASGAGDALRIPLSGPRALMALADGSFLALGVASTVRLMPHDRKARVAPRASLLPGSGVFSDRVDPERFWVLAGQSLVGYGLEGELAGMLPIAASTELEAFDGRAIGSLRDGGFLYATASGFSNFHGTGRKQPVSGDPAGIVRILPGSRPDTVWLVRDSGTAELHRLLLGKLYRLKAVPLAAAPYDAVAEGVFLAVLELRQPDSAPWSWDLEVFDTAGERRFATTLPAVEEPSPDWVAHLVRDRNLALSSSPPRVAVGGPGSLDLFDIEKTERIPVDQGAAGAGGKLGRDAPAR